MLVETFKNEIVTVVLSSGQEMIGKFVSNDGDTLVINNPLTIAFGPEGAAFQQYTMTGSTSNKVSVNAKMIITVVKARDDIAKNYLEATSGIVMPG